MNKNKGIDINQYEEYTNYHTSRINYIDERVKKLTRYLEYNNEYDITSQEIIQLIDMYKLDKRKEQEKIREYTTRYTYRHGM